MDHWRFAKRRKMKFTDIVGYLLFVGIFCISIDYTQQSPSSNNNNNGKRYPQYSLQNMPKTDFSCRGKILGGYYADADTQCQMFHICVKIAGVGVQDFRFLCPNGTAFDQEAQTCADFGDVDCDQATLFYGSDNFDLYRIGSGFDVSKRPTPATEDESTFHLQRAESNDLRRSKQPIAVQNSLYNVGSSFNQQQQQQHQKQQSPQQQPYELTSLKPANQYQPQKVTTTTPRNSLIIRKSTTTTTIPLVTVKPTPFVLASSNSNNNDEIFKGSHSSNFYSNRNSNDDDDDYKKSSITNTAKSRHRSRGRTQYRGTPATTTTTTTTFKPPVVQNYTTFSPFTVKSTTASPFKFTFASTVRSSNGALSNVGNQLNSTPLGPLQQQYQQTNYNNNNFINFKAQTTTSAPIPTTLRSNFRPGSFNLVTTQPTFSAPLRQVVSSPTPFNSNHLNGNNQNAKPITNNAAPFTNNNIFSNNNLLTSNSSNSNRQRIFDNHNVINNYQTTSPFGNQKTVANHLPANNTVLRLAPTQANHFFPQNSANNLQKNSSFYQQNSVTTFHPLTTTLAPIGRNSVTPDKPTFKQQDLLNQFNSNQQRFTQTPPNQTPAQINNVQNKGRPEQAQNYRVQLHYDINDYLTTDKHVSQSYSPTSEQYRSVQTFSTPQASQSNQYFTTKYYDSVYSTTPKINKQQFDTNNQYQTQQDRPSQAVNPQINFKAPIITTPQSVPKQPININNINSINNNNNYVSTSTKKFSTLVPKENYAPTTFKPLFYFNVAKQINDHLSTPGKLKAATDTIAQSSITSTTSRTVSVQPIFNRGLDFSHSKESSTNAPQFPPKSQFQSQPQPQTLKAYQPQPLQQPQSLKAYQPQPLQQPQPQPQKPFQSQPLQQSQPQPQKPFQPQFPPQFQSPSQPLFQPAKPNTSEIDEDDGQYHPELYEKDFARYKIKNRKKQQQIQNLHKPNFAKAQTDFNKFNQQNFNRGTPRSFITSTSTEEELLTAAHSQNIAASGNNLWASSKNAANTKVVANSKSAVNSKPTFNLPVKAPTIPPNSTTKKVPSIPKDGKDVSYDYAYYDSGNDTPQDYSDVDLDFTKTRNH